MKNTVQYIGIIVVVILVSVSTSYLTTIVLENKNNLQQQNVQPNITQNITRTKVNLTAKSINFNVDASGNYVKVETNQALDNLTITYKYACLNGTIFTESVDYGSIAPYWGVGVMIEAGKIPELNFLIPEHIIRASSSLKTNENSGVTIWDIRPQVEVLEIYGYS